MDLNETVTLTDKRSLYLSADHGRACDKVRFAEAEAKNTARRIRERRHDLRMAERRKSTLSQNAYINLVGGIERDLKEVEARYLALTGGRVPAEAA